MNWKRYLKIFLVTLFLVLMQDSFLSVLFSFQLPVLVFCFALSFLSEDKKESAFFTAFTGGLLMDLMSSNLLGLTAAFILGVLLVTAYVKDHFFDNFIFLYLLSIGGFSFLWRVIFLEAGTAFPLGFFALNYAVFLIFRYAFKKFFREDESESF